MLDEVDIEQLPIAIKELVAQTEGLYGAHVVTIQLARDGRGWLRLAG